MSLPRGVVLERSNPHLFKGIPNCPECEKDCVRFAGSWVCTDCVKMGNGRGETTLGSLFPNRAARRAAARNR